jgi:hypothetical protein
MVAQGRWRRRRPASLVRCHDVDLGGRGTGVRPPFERSAVLLRGCCASVVREWVAQGHGADSGLTAQCRTMVGMASPGELAEQCRDMIPRRVRGTACVDSSLTRALAGVTTLNVRSGEQVRGQRACEGLERGGTTREGVTGPRARRNLIRGGVPALERGGVSFVRRCATRAKRSFARGRLGRLPWWAAGPCHWAVVVLSAF